MNNLLKKEWEEVKTHLIPPILLTQMMVNVFFLFLQNTTIYTIIQKDKDKRT